MVEYLCSTSERVCYYQYLCGVPVVAMLALPHSSRHIPVWYSVCTSQDSPLVAANGQLLLPGVPMWLLAGEPPVVVGQSCDGAYTVYV